jgi:hypothetical protein
MIDRKVKDRLQHDDEYIQAEKAHAALLDKAVAKLVELQDASTIPAITIIPVGYSAHKGAKIIDLLIQYGENELEEKIREGLRQRSFLHKRICHRLQKEIHVFPILCPDCRLPYKNSRESIRHLKLDLPEQLWQDFGDDEEEDEEE